MSIAIYVGHSQNSSTIIASLNLPQRHFHHSLRIFRCDLASVTVSHLLTQPRSPPAGTDAFGHIASSLSGQDVAKTPSDGSMDSNSISSSIQKVNSFRLRSPPANTDDRKPIVDLTQYLFGKLYGDKGYVSEALSKVLKTQRVFLVSKVRKNMKTKAISDFDALMLKKRMCIESVIEHLKHQSQLEDIATGVSSTSKLMCSAY